MLQEMCNSIRKIGLKKERFLKIVFVKKKKKKKNTMGIFFFLRFVQTLSTF